MEKTEFLLRSPQILKFPEVYLAKLKAYFHATPKEIAEAILKHSDFYIDNPSFTTPWDEPWAQLAQVWYYFPLNYIRVQAVINRGNQVGFFKNLDSFVDFGAGLGPLTIQLEKLIPKGTCLETSSEARKFFKNIHNSSHSLWDNSTPAISNKNTLGAFSYVLTEITELPNWAYECEALMIVEPSTHQDARKLMELRKKLIERGYHIYAPCTHHQGCPLLEHSKKDWCHDRVHWEMPDWFKKIEQELPMKNKTLTFSYLLARKTPPQKKLDTRVVGDQREERGKTKIMICRKNQREFLSWLDKAKINQNLYRGDLIDIPIRAEIKGDEVRVASHIIVN